MSDVGLRPSRTMLLGLVLLLGLATMLLVLELRSGPDTAPPASLARSAVEQDPPPVPLARDTSYVRTEVLPSGDMAVTHWVESSAVLLAVELSLPDATAAGGITAHDVRVVAGGRRATGPARILDTTGTYSFLAADSVQISYRLRGGVTRSTSAPGRALVDATALEVASRADIERVTHAVLAPEVLSLACAAPSPPAVPAPCGAPDPDGGWIVELDDDRLGDRVLAQVTLE